jgi:hypothetical protein
MATTCEFCNKEFKSDKILKTHQTTAKYCLRIQNENISEILTNFKCEYCDKFFTTKLHLSRHNKTCNNLKIIKKKEDENIIRNLEEEIIKLKTIIDQLEKKDNDYQKQLEKKDIFYQKQITELQDKLERLASKAISKPTIQTNNTINHKCSSLAILNLDNNDIKQKVEKSFTIDHYRNGQKGVAEFTLNNVLKNDKGELAYKCLDYARRTCGFKDENGECHKDARANILTTHIAPHVIKKAIKIFKKNISKLNDDVDLLKIESDILAEIKSLGYDNNSFVEAICRLTLNNINLVENEDGEVQFIIEDDSDDEEDYIKINDTNTIKLEGIDWVSYEFYPNMRMCLFSKGRKEHGEHIDYNNIDIFDFGMNKEIVNVTYSPNKSKIIFDFGVWNDNGRKDDRFQKIEKPNPNIKDLSNIRFIQYLNNDTRVKVMYFNRKCEEWILDETPFN